MAQMAIALVMVYRWGLSPILTALGARCRFYPTCSQYAIDAFKAYGFCRGLGKTLRRLSKCHPYHPGGYDPA